MQDESINYAEGETGMTDFQFMSYMKVQDERDALKTENAQFREEIERLRSENAAL